MADEIGSKAVAAGYPLVPGTGEEGKVKYGAREINRTRDMVADLDLLLNNYGSAAPNNDDGKPDGTFYFRIL